MDIYKQNVIEIIRYFQDDGILGANAIYQSICEWLICELIIDNLDCQTFDYLVGYTKFLLNLKECKYGI